MSRRSAARYVAAILVVVLIVVFWPRQEGLTTEVVIGTVNEIETSQVVYLEEHDLFVVATEAGFVVLSDDSRHVGDRVLYCRSNNMFSSPAHGELFDRLGRYFGGPADGDLGRYEARVSGDRVLVDLATLSLPDRSTAADEPSGPSCEGPEDPPGFYRTDTP
jgi:hypothetical protein